MGFSIYRTDLTKPGKPRKVAGYERIGLHTAIELTGRLAQEEAESRDDVASVSRVHSKHAEQTVTRFTLIGTGGHCPSLAEYTYRETR